MMMQAMLTCRLFMRGLPHLADTAGTIRQARSERLMNRCIGPILF